MFNGFNSDVFVEIGEAIGDIGRSLWPRASRGQRMRETFHRLRDTSPTLNLDAASQREGRPDKDVIEGSFRIVGDEEEGA